MLVLVSAGTIEEAIQDRAHKKRDIDAKVIQVSGRGGLHRPAGRGKGCASASPQHLHLHTGRGNAMLQLLLWLSLADLLGWTR